MASNAGAGGEELPAEKRARACLESLFVLSVTFLFVLSSRIVCAIGDANVFVAFVEPGLMHTQIDTHAD